MNMLQTNPALLIIDMQCRYFTTPEDKADLADLISHINELTDFFHTRNLPVIHVVNSQEQESETKYLQEINHGENDITMTRLQPSAFADTGLEEILWKMDVNTVVLAGYSSGGSIGLTVIEAYEHDFMPVLAGEAILGMDEAMLQTLENDYAIQPVSNGRIKELAERWCHGDD